MRAFFKNIAAVSLLTVLSFIIAELLIQEDMVHLWSHIKNALFIGVTILGRKIYVIGGLNDDGPLTSMERFHIRSQKWKSLPDLLEPRFSMGVVTWAGSIFVFGGRSDRQSLGSMEVYHPKEEKWVFAPAQLNDNRCEFGHVVYKNKIFCFGGRGVTSIECYDFLNKQWRIVGRVSDNTYSVNCLVYPPLSWINCTGLHLNSSVTHPQNGTSFPKEVVVHNWLLGKPYNSAALTRRSAVHIFMWFVGALVLGFLEGRQTL